jgi:succinylglutamate desuccinylase
MRIKNEGQPDVSEEYEFQALIKILEQRGLNINFDQLLFLDLHTTSSNTYPYIIFNRKPSNFAFAKKFPLTVVSGIVKYIPGHFDHYLTLKGHTGFTVEAGQHESPDSIEYHESTIWMALVVSGMVEEKDIPGYKEYVDKLDLSSQNHGNFEVIFKYQIRQDEVFKMKQGFSNFSKISKGQLLAGSDGELIYSEWDDYIFLPLYQSQDSDGFFVIHALAF